MAIRFEGKTALVTGGSRGIGRAIVGGLVKEGAKVYVIGKSQENLEKLKKEIPSVNTIQVDLKDCDWNKTKNVLEQIGIIDLLVNNAGIVDNAIQFIDMSKELFSDVIDTNCTSAFNITQTVARGLISARRSGSIVNISSIWGLKPTGLHVGYCVSKAMVEMLTKVTALELGPHKIRVNSVNPTVIPTDLTKDGLSNKDIIVPFLQRHPMGKFAELKDAVNTTLFLLSDEATMVTGCSVPVDGGFLLS